MKLMVIAAEASGDSLGAGLMAALKTRLPDIQCVGTGGVHMAQQGLTSLFDISELGVLGLIEGVKAWPMVSRRAREVAAYAAQEKPDAVVLIDSWGFTLRCARRIRAVLPDVPLIKYVGPQVWGSRPGRAKTLAAAVDHLMSIHVFDVPYFEKAGLKTTYVGNPVLARDFSHADGARFRASHGLGADQPLLLVLPGSRRSEIDNVYPTFAETAARLQAERPDLAVAVPVSPMIASMLLSKLATWAKPPVIVTHDTDKDDAFVAADVALACSGTVTTELAIAGCPMVIGYRFAGWLNYRLLRLIATTEKVALMNIAAKRYVAPEFLQDDCVADRLTPAVARLLDSSQIRANQRADQFKAIEAMGRTPDMRDPSACAAETLIQILDNPL